MKKKKDISIYENLDGELFFDVMTGEFVLNFDDEQKQALQYGLEHGMPIQTVAYTFIPADSMHAIMEFMAENQGSLRLRNIDRIDYWKVAMIFYKNPTDCRNVLLAKKCGVDVFAEFSNIREIDGPTIELISNAAEGGVNVCKQVKSGMRGDELLDYITRKCYVKQFFWKISKFLFVLRHPLAKTTGLF